MELVQGLKHFQTHEIQHSVCSFDSNPHFANNNAPAWCGHLSKLWELNIYSRTKIPEGNERVGQKLEQF